MNADTPPEDAPNAPTTADAAGVNRLLRRLDLDADPSRSLTWIGTAGAGSLNRSQRLFGGLISGQILVAAGRARPDRRIHSMQQAFLRAGNVVDPLYYRVTPLFEGRTHAMSIVAVEQSGEVISHAQIGYTSGREGQPTWTPDSLPSNEPPEGVADRENMRGNVDHDPPIAMRVVKKQQLAASPDLDIWFKAAGDPGDDPVAQRGLLGYSSDRGMLSTATKLVGAPENRTTATVNHSIWFHAPIDLTSWHLHRVTVRQLGDGLGLLDGQMIGPGGTIVASTRQEGSIRV